MPIRSTWASSGFHYYDDTSFERVLPVRAVSFYDDFLDPGSSAGFPTAKTSGVSWIKKTVATAGAPSVAVVANGAGGIVQLALDATNEKQEVSLYFGDQRTFDATKKLFFETRIALPVIPSAGVVAVFGLAASWTDGPEAQAEYIHFALNGSGGLLCETNDGSTTKSAAAGITIATTTEWHDLLIDVSDPTSVKFLVDGNPVAETTVFPFAATGSNAVLQPYASIYKAAGVGTATAAIDFVRLWSNRV